MSTRRDSLKDEASQHAEHAPYASATCSEMPPQQDDEDDFSWNYDVLTNLLALYLIYFASTWAMSVPAASIAFIMREFPSDHHTTSWIGAGPSLVLCVISIFIGDLSDIFGRKVFLIVGAVFGLVGMLVAGCSTSVDMIIGGQVLNGIGLTLGFLSTPLLAEVVPKRWRAPIVGGGTALAVVAGVAGQISQGAAMKAELGGENRGWRLGLYIGAGLFGIALASLILFYRPGPRPNPEGTSVTRRLLEVDWIGVFVATAGLVLFLLALQFGGQNYPWTSPLVLSFLIIGIVLLVGLAIWEWKFVDQGLFPKSLFQHRNYGVTIVLNFIEGMVIFSSQAFLPQITLALLTQDYVMAGVYNLPNAAGSLLGVVGAGAVASKTKEAKWVAVVGVGALTLGGGLLALMNPDVNFAAWFFASASVGVGIGSLGVIIPVISSLCTPNQYIATSVAVGTSVRGLGGAIGLVIFMQIYSTKLESILPRKLGEAAVMGGVALKDVPALIAAYMGHDPSLMQIPGVDEELIASLAAPEAQAQADSFRFIWYALIPFAVLTLLISCFLKTTKEQMTMQVASRVQTRHGHGLEKEAKNIEKDHE